MAEGITPERLARLIADELTRQSDRSMDMGDDLTEFMVFTPLDLVALAERLLAYLAEKRPGDPPKPGTITGVTVLSRGALDPIVTVTVEK